MHRSMSIKLTTHANLAQRLKIAKERGKLYLYSSSVPSWHITGNFTLSPEWYIVNLPRIDYASSINKEKPVSAMKFRLGGWKLKRRKKLYPRPRIEHPLPVVHMVTQSLFWIILPPQLLYFCTESFVFSRSLISDRRARHTNKCKR